MKSFVWICFLLLLVGCSYNGFDADEWDGGANELKLELSETTLSLKDYRSCVDTVFITTNGDSWDFQEDSLASWCRCAKIDSMLMIFVDENKLNMPRMAKIEIYGYYNQLKHTEKLSIVQPAALFSDSGFVASEPFMTFERHIEWNNYMAPITWSFTETIRNKILSELGLLGVINEDFTDLVERRVIVINGYKIDGTYTDNVLTDHTSVTGYWYKSDGTVATYGGGVMCCEFKKDDSGNIEYDRGSIYLHPSNVKNENAQFCSYYIFSCGDKRVVLKWILNVNECKALQVLKEYNFEYSVVANMYENQKEEFFRHRYIDLQDSIAEIRELIGGEINSIQVYRHGDKELPMNNPLHYEGYIDYDKVTLQFGEEGLISNAESYCTICLTKSGEIIVDMRSFLADLYGVDYPELIRSKWLMGNDITGKAVEVGINFDVEFEEHCENQYALHVSIPARQSIDYGNDGYGVYNDNLYEYFAEFDEIFTEIETWLGKPVDTLYMNKYEEGLDVYTFYDGCEYDYWFGENGIEKWGTDEVLFLFDPMTRRAFKYHDLESYPATANCVYRIVNSKTSEIAEIILIVDIE